MTIQRIQELLWQVGNEMERVATYAEYEDLYIVFTALKTQWNKKTGNAVIHEVVVL